jgi:hypothetical protein
VQNDGRVAERGHVAHDLVERAVVAGLKLLLFFLVAQFGIAAGVGAAAAGNLRDAQLEGGPARFGVFARGHDDAGVRHGEAQDGDDLFEVVVRNRVRRIGPWRSRRPARCAAR